MTHPRYPRLFSPLRLGPIEVPNRFFFAPHGASLSIGTKPSDDLVAYTCERVREGGVGLAIVALAVHDRGRTRQPSPYPPENVAAFRALADAVHDAGGKIFAETLYWWGGTGQWAPLSPPAPSFGPSTRQFRYRDRAFATHAMNAEEIAAMLGVFRQTAGNLRAAGFDGIMLHCSHAALLEQFVSPAFNTRDDAYGGDFARRITFLVEVLETVREAAGLGMAIGMRFNCDEMISWGYDTAYARKVLIAICARGLLDYVDLDVGLEPQQLHYGMPTVFSPTQLYRASVEAVRGVADIPVLSVLGRITQAAEAEEALESGVVDMVGAARQLIAEPAFIRNARDGGEGLSRSCIACNWCIAATGDGAQGCTINPASYRERIWGEHSFAPAAERSRVIVVGGGPGGLEAARVAALKGHRVTLFEARERLGGALALWADLPGRATYGKAVDWWAGELARLHVDVRLGVSADAAMVLAEKPDAVVIATGSLHSHGGRSMAFDADIPGSDRAFVYRPEDILLDGARPTGRVVLLDFEGLHASAGVAELLAAQGCELLYVTEGFTPISSRLVENFEGRFVVQRLKEASVRFLPTTWVRAIGDSEVVLYDVHTGAEWSERCDAVVLSGGRLPENALAIALEGSVPQLFTIGDALAPRFLAAATYEGQHFARLIGEPDAPATIAQAFFRADDPELAPIPADRQRRVLEGARA